MITIDKKRKFSKEIVIEGFPSVPIVISFSYQRILRNYNNEKFLLYTTSIDRALQLVKLLPEGIDLAFYSYSNKDPSLNKLNVLNPADYQNNMRKNKTGPRLIIFLDELGNKFGAATSWRLDNYCYVIDNSERLLEENQIRSFVIKAHGNNSIVYSMSAPAMELPLKLLSIFDRYIFYPTYELGLDILRNYSRLNGMKYMKEAFQFAAAIDEALLAFSFNCYMYFDSEQFIPYFNACKPLDEQAPLKDTIDRIIANREERDGAKLTEDKNKEIVTNETTQLNIDYEKISKSISIILKEELLNLSKQLHVRDTTFKSTIDEIGKKCIDLTKSDRSNSDLLPEIKKEISSLGLTIENKISNIAIDETSIDQSISTMQAKFNSDLEIFLENLAQRINLVIKNGKVNLDSTEVSNFVTNPLISEIRRILNSHDESYDEGYDDSSNGKMKKVMDDVTNPSKDSKGLFGDIQS